MEVLRKIHFNPPSFILLGQLHKLIYLDPLKVSEPRSLMKEKEFWLIPKLGIQFDQFFAIVRIDREVLFL